MARRWSAVTLTNTFAKGRASRNETFPIASVVLCRSAPFSFTFSEQVIRDARPHRWVPMNS